MAGRTNHPKELARYELSDGPRVVQGQRVRGSVRLVDVPADGRPGRRYVIERELTVMAEVDGIVADYLAQARRWDAPPAEVNWLAGTPEEVAA